VEDTQHKASKKHENQIPANKKKKRSNQDNPANALQQNSPKIPT